MAENNEINFEDLRKELPYKWRVQSFSKFKPEATCVAYVDSRDVQKRLDDVVGPGNWQDEYYVAKNNLFCRIGIRVGGEWTWKGDCGTESNVDKEKGEASDAFKRAAVKWGIGRFLYDLGMYKLKTDKKLGETPGNPMPLDESGNKIWDITKHINALIAKQKAAKAPAAKATPKAPDPEKKAIAEAALTISKPEPKTLEELQDDFKTLMQNDVFTDDEREKALEPLRDYDYSKLTKVIAGTEKLIAKRQTVAA